MAGGFDPNQAQADIQANTSSGAYQNSGSSSSNDDPPVWLGLGARSSLAGKPLPGGQRVPKGVARAGVDQMSTVSQAYMQIYDWSEARRRQWCELLQSKGLVDQGDYSFDTAEKAWQAAVDKSAMFFSRGKKVSPEQYISRYALGGANATAGGASGQPKTTTETATTEKVFTDPVEARYALRKTLETELHRAPTEREIRQFQDLLHRQEDEPSTATTTTHTDGQGNTTYNTTHQDDTSPVSPEAVADEFARSGKVGRERNTTKAGIDYYAAAMKTIGAGGGLA